MCADSRYRVIEAFDCFLGTVHVGQGTVHAKDADAEPLDVECGEIVYIQHVRDNVGTATSSLESIYAERVRRVEERHLLLE